MQKTPPFGIRSTFHIGTPDGDYIVDSVKLANEQAPEGFSFYLDEPDIAERIIGGRYCIDLYGWLVPASKKSEFESIWTKFDDDSLDEFKYVTVSFDEVDGKPVARFW